MSNGTFTFFWLNLILVYHNIGYCDKYWFATFSFCFPTTFPHCSARKCVYTWKACCIFLFMKYCLTVLVCSSIINNNRKIKCFSLFSLWSAYFLLLSVRMLHGTPHLSLQYHAMEPLPSYIPEQRCVSFTPFIHHLSHGRERSSRIFISCTAIDIKLLTQNVNFYDYRAIETTGPYVGKSIGCVCDNFMFVSLAADVIVLIVSASHNFAFSWAWRCSFAPIKYDQKVDKKIHRQ